jgi:hypothetical protein
MSTCDSVNNGCSLDAVWLDEETHDRTDKFIDDFDAGDKMSGVDVLLWHALIVCRAKSLEAGDWGGDDKLWRDANWLLTNFCVASQTLVLLATAGICCCFASAAGDIIHNLFGDRPGEWTGSNSKLRLRVAPHAIFGLCSLLTSINGRSENDRIYNFN